MRKHEVLGAGLLAGLGVTLGLCLGQGGTARELLSRTHGHLNQVGQISTHPSPTTPGPRVPPAGTPSFTPTTPWRTAPAGGAVPPFPLPWTAPPLRTPGPTAAPPSSPSPTPRATPRLSATPTPTPTATAPFGLSSSPPAPIPTPTPSGRHHHRPTPTPAPTATAEP